MATSIQNFLDFMDATGPVYLTGPDVLINEAVKRNYLFGDLIREKNQAIQGGKEIKDVLMLDDSSTDCDSTITMPALSLWDFASSIAACGTVNRMCE